MFFWNSLAFSMIQRMLAIWSLVPLPFLNPAWISGSSWFRYCWSLCENYGTDRQKQWVARFPSWTRYMSQGQSFLFQEDFWATSTCWWSPWMQRLSLLLWSTFMEGGTVGITAQPKCKSCFPTKHTGFKSLCTLKESEVELKDITSLSFEIKEHQTWLGQYPYTKDPTCHGKQECLRPELHPVHFCPSQRCRYSVTSAGPRELEQRGDWDEDE